MGILLKMLQKTLVLIKPDGVARSLIGEIIKRFENTGLKIVGLKMVSVDKDFAKQHYTEELAKRRGNNVRNYMVDFITSGPVVAIALNGVNAIDNVRKLVGETEPKSAMPGTIRGDFTHVSYQYCDSKKIGVKNVIHASANEKDAKLELSLWFNASEIYDYKNVHDEYVL